MKLRQLATRGKFSSLHWRISFVLVRQTHLHSSKQIIQQVQYSSLTDSPPHNRSFDLSILMVLKEFSEDMHYFRTKFSIRSKTL